jgi:hypothetical protein
MLMPIRLPDLFGSISVEFRRNGLGISPSNVISLTNLTLATVGLNQYSPAIYYEGQGWKTTATAASQSVKWRQYLLPVTYSSAASSNLVFQYMIGGESTWRDGILFTGPYDSGYASITAYSGVFGNTLSVGGYVSTPQTRATTNNSLQSLGSVADGATAIGHKIGNLNTLTTSGAKIASFYSDNLTTEVAYIDKTGTFFTKGEIQFANGLGELYRAGLLGASDGVTFLTSALSMIFAPAKADGATSIGIYMGSYNAFSTAGAKLISIRNSTVEKAYIDKDGIIVAETTKRVACGGGSTGATVVPNGTVTLEINGVSYYLLTAAAA